MNEPTGKSQQAERADEPAGEASAGKPVGRARYLASSFDRPRQEILMAVVLLGTFVYLRVQIVSLVRGRRGAAYLDPDFWPGWLLNVLILLTVLYLGQAILRMMRAASYSAVEPSVKTGTEPAGTAEELVAAADGATDAESIDASSEQPGDVDADDTTDSTVQGNPLMLIAGFGLIFAFIWLMPRIGFIPSGLLFAVTFMMAIGERRWRIVSSIPIVLMALILYVFTRLLVVPLPRGRGVFLQFSTYFY